MGRCECEGGRSRLSKYAGLALLFCLLWLTAGCGNSFLDEQLSSQGQGSVSTPAPTFRALGTAVERRIGQGGGVLEAQAEDGTVYTLTVPEGALAEEQLLRMLPVAVSGRLGLPVELGFAVTIEPSGTQFTGGALLEITLPQGVDARAFRAYVMDDSGSPMSLYASSVSGQTVSFRLYHLTTPGISDSPVPDPPVSDGASTMDTMAAQVASRLSQIQTLQQLGADASQIDPLFREIDNILRDFFQNSLRPLLQSTAQSGSDAACQSALRDALRFEQVVQLLGPRSSPRTRSEPS